MWLDVLLVAGTWVLALSTIGLAWRTQEMARAANETAKATLEAQAKAAVFQEVQVLMPFLDRSYYSSFASQGEAGKALLDRMKTLGLVPPDAVF
jgi:hypothetical protein